MYTSFLHIAFSLVSWYINTIVMKKANEMDSSAQTLTNRAYVSIKDLIMSYALKPGEVLSEIELARRLKMSRTPVHQALLHLKRDGFLEDTSGTGWKVYSLSLADIREIFAVKIAIENIIMEETALNKTASKEGIRLCLARMQEAASERDLDKWIRLDHELHDNINALASNSRAVQISESLSEQLYRFQSRYPPLDLNQRQAEHDIIVGCILSGDARGAQLNHEKGLNQLREEMEYVLRKMVFPLTNDFV
jgi:DNA-binding GntR family transcriptional regulator